MFLAVLNASVSAVKVVLAALDDAEGELPAVVGADTDASGLAVAALEETTGNAVAGVRSAGAVDVDERPHASARTTLGTKEKERRWRFNMVPGEGRP